MQALQRWPNIVSMSHVCWAKSPEKMGRLNSSKSPAANVRGPHRPPEKMSRLNSSKSPAANVRSPHRSSEMMGRLNSSKSPAAYVGGPQTKSNHLHPLQVENCDSNSRLVVYEDDNGKFRPERVNHFECRV